MSLYKRKGSPHWWVKFTIDGQRVRKSSGTEDRAKAEEFEAKLKAAHYDQARLGVKPRHTWKEAVVRWVQETRHKKSHEDDLRHLRWLDPHLSGLTLNEITRDVVDELIAAKRAVKETRLGKPISNASINRMLAVLRAILRRSERVWEWIDRAPAITLLPEHKGRVRWLTPPEAQRLLDELPPHLSCMAAFTLETGLRASNVMGLRWDQIDMQRSCAWVHAEEAKAGRAIPVALSRRAKELIREQMGKHQVFVFTYNDNPITGQLSTKAWRSALQRAEITNFRWHDLRHTWASWHIQSGTPLEVLQEMGAWEDAEMVRRYAHLSAERLLQFVERSGTKSATQPTEDDANSL